MKRNCKTCGTEFETCAFFVKRGQGRYCSQKCYWRRFQLKLVGKKFGRLTIVSFAHAEKGKSHFNAKCDCGKELVVCMNRVKTGSTRSCGCLRSKPGSAARELYGKYVTRARQRGFPLEFTFRKFLVFVKQNCFYCGTPPSQEINSWGNREVFIYNGIDRWNNDFGYSKKNSVPCCGDCNRQKLEQSGEEFIARCKKIAVRFRTPSKSI